MVDIQTVHENRDGTLVTIKSVAHDGDVYKFEQRPGRGYEFTGDGEAPVAVRQELEAHLGPGEELANPVEPDELLDDVDDVDEDSEATDREVGTAAERLEEREDEDA
jgi:hypothetical protein